MTLDGAVTLSAGKGCAWPFSISHRATTLVLPEEKSNRTLLLHCLVSCPQFRKWLQTIEVNRHLVSPNKPLSPGLCCPVTVGSS